MKRIILNLIILHLSFILFSCMQEKKDKEISTDLVDNPSTASGNESQETLPVVEFAKEIHDFGKITQGEKVSYSFKFKNTGKGDLLIASAQGSCGCTVPHYPDKPVAPGEEGAIDVIFDSDGKEGIVKKTITVVTNAVPNTKTLTITTEIIAPQNSQEKENN